ncbi:MAG: phosphoribosyltransferase [Cyclobacteriaceae bacterium]
MLPADENHLSLPFADRESAATLLAEKIRGKIKTCTIVLAVPRGGVVTGKVLAKILGLELDLILCKKVGHPANPEYAIGSVCADGYAVQTDHSLPSYQNHFIRQSQILAAQLSERYKLLTGKTAPAGLKNKEVLICDDGAATGSTLLAAVSIAKQQGAEKISVAVPVMSETASNALNKICNHIFCLDIPTHFGAVGEYYIHFPTVEDDVVKHLLQT